MVGLEALAGQPTEPVGTRLELIAQPARRVLVALVFEELPHEFPARILRLLLVLARRVRQQHP